MAEISQGIALLGNPGSGKSTILNTILDEFKSPSGINTATGLTLRVECFRTENMLYFDTPGLNDFKKRKEVGEDIENLLKKRKSLRLIFVVRTNAGRITPEDTLTIKTILDCITGIDLTDKFGILVNQVSKGIMEELSDPENDSLLRESLTQHYKTKYIEYLPYVENAYDKNNCLLGPEIADQIRRFIALLPETKPQNAQIDHIRIENYDQKLLELSEAIDNLYNEMRKLNTKIAQDRKEYEKEKKRLLDELENLENKSKFFNKEKFDEWVKKHWS